MDRVLNGVMFLLPFEAAFCLPFHLICCSMRWLINRFVKEFDMASAHPVDVLSQEDIDSLLQKVKDWNEQYEKMKEEALYGSMLIALRKLEIMDSAHTYVLACLSFCYDQVAFFRSKERLFEMGISFSATAAWFLVDIETACRRIEQIDNGVVIRKPADTYALPKPVAKVVALQVPIANGVRDFWAEAQVNKPFDPLSLR